MTAGAALNNICIPSGVVETVATLWALHPAIAGEKGATHAQRKAVGLVLAQKLFGKDSRHWDNGIIRGAVISVMV